MANAPKFAPLTGDAQPVQHRVFLANSDLIGGNIDDKRNVVPHVPRLRIPSAPAGEWSDRVLFEDSIAFEGLDRSHGDKKHHDQLAPLPSLWLKGDRPALQQGVLESWTPYAAHTSTSSAKAASVSAPNCRRSSCRCGLRASPRSSTATGMPAPPRRIRSPTARSSITNLPADPNACGDSDYLLHYFATAVDLRNHAPVWTPQVTAEKKIQRMREGRLGEVYCSNSTYP